MTNEPNTTEEIEAKDGRASYCPEDDKLRLYVGWVSRPEYEALRAEGWTATPKQDCDFVATWTPERRDTCLRYADLIEDEDQSPEDRAADRAERFSEYRDKRTGEAIGQADRYDAGPSAHGYQSQARADRAAARHDRIAGRALDAWSKAEYWQRRTAGVISHALYVSKPAVRMGRIKELEAELRKREKSLVEYAERFTNWQKIAAMAEPEKQTAIAKRFAYFEHGDYVHPRTGRKSYLYSLANGEDERETDPLNGAEIAALWLASASDPILETEWTQHLKLRLAYEHQMLEAQGGRAAFVEMVPGGFIGSYQIQKVNKSNATGRTVSVSVLAPSSANFDRNGKAYGEDNPRPLTMHTITVERMAADAYRPPTPEELQAFEESKKARKAAAPKAAPCPLINPTDADAEKLQAIWNERARAKHEARNVYTSPEARARHSEQFEPAGVVRITQAAYSANSKGSYARAETRGLCKSAEIQDRASNMYCKAEKERAERIGAPVCTVRMTTGGKCNGWSIPCVIILTDKPQKPLPAEVWPVPVQAEAPASTETQFVLVG